MQDFWGAGLYLTCSAGQIHAPFNSSKFPACLVINPCWASALPAYLRFWRSAYVLRWVQVQSAKRSDCMKSHGLRALALVVCAVLRGGETPAGYDVWSDGWQNSVGLITNQSAAMNAML